MPRRHRPRRHHLLTAAVVLVLAAAVSGQQPRDNGVPSSQPAQTRDGAGAAMPAGTGVIAGRVMHRDNQSVPVARAFVSLISGGATERMAVTDDQGRFWFGGLPAGRYMMRFNKATYAGTMYGGNRAHTGGVTIVLAKGQRITNLLATMFRGCVVTGRVVDEHGIPIMGASVTTYERVMVSGKPVFRAAGAGMTATDDRGIYRFYGFEPGDWIVGVRYLPYPLSSSAVTVATADELKWADQGATSSAGNEPAPAKPVKFSRVYAPGVADPTAATVLTFGMSEEKSGIDITVPLVPTSSISGRLTRADGLPVGPTRIAVVSAMRDNPLAPQGSRVVVGPDGEFMADGLEPGQYLLMALGLDAPSRAPGGRSGPTGVGLFAMSNVTIAGQDVSGVDLVMEPAMSASGRVVFDGTRPPPADLTGVTVIARPAPDSIVPGIGAGRGQVAADGSLVIGGLVPGTYILSATAPDPAWVLDSMTAGGRDVLDQWLDVQQGESIPPIEVRFTDQKTELAGTLTDSSGQPAPEYSVLVFGVNRADWHQASRWVHVPTRPGSDGRFSFTGLPPGEYYVAAISRYDPLEWYTPEFLEQLTNASIRVTLVAGQTTRQDLRVR